MHIKQYFAFVRFLQIFSLIIADSSNKLRRNNFQNENNTISHKLEARRQIFNIVFVYRTQ